MMSRWWGPPEPEKISFRKAVEAAWRVLEKAERKAVSAEELTAVADGWLMLVSELNPRGK